MDFISAEGRSKRERGVQQVESTGRKHLMCAFWTVCFIIWVNIGWLYYERTANAAKINKDFKYPIESKITEVKTEQPNDNKLNLTKSGYKLAFSYKLDNG